MLPITEAWRLFIGFIDLGFGRAWEKIFWKIIIHRREDRLASFNNNELVLCLMYMAPRGLIAFGVAGLGMANPVDKSLIRV